MLTIRAYVYVSFMCVKAVKALQDCADDQAGLSVHYTYMYQNLVNWFIFLLLGLCKTGIL